MPLLTEPAFGELYRSAARPLWTYVYRVTGHAADADDIVQEAFCRILRADVGTLGSDEQRRYLFRVAGNLIADRWRRSTREREWQALQAEPTATQPGVADSDVVRTFAHLKPRERALLWLAYVEGHDHETIASMLRLRRGSVKVLLSRARARLRGLLGTIGVL